MGDQAQGQFRQSRAYDATGACQSTPRKKPRLVFSRYEDLYFLSEFWTAGSNTGREIQISDQEKAMEKALAAKRQEHVSDRSRQDKPKAPHTVQSRGPDASQGLAFCHSNSTMEESVFIYSRRFEESASDQ